jgi:hypothetical protein
LEEERNGESADQGFLPPEPAGPEPELGSRPPQPAPPQGPQYPPPTQQQPQAPPQTYGYPPPPPGYGPPPAGYGTPSPPPAGYGYPPPPPPGQGHPPPPGYAYPPQPQWGYPQQAVPDNGPAVAGFVFSLVSGSLLIISGGFSTIISIACAIVGIVYSRKGKKKVDAGETPKHRGLAKAGVIIGWVSLALSILATIAWSLVLAFAIADDDFDWGTEPDTVRVTAAALLAGARIIGG